MDTTDLGSTTMPIDPACLAALAGAYAKGMTPIRGRRVQRLLQREFGGAEVVLLAQLGSGSPAVLGLSPSGAAICATDGTGRQASVVKWAHGSAEALETQFDLHKDSLPALASATLSLASLRSRGLLRVPASPAAPAARRLVAEVLRVLA